VAKGEAVLPTPQESRRHDEPVLEKGRLGREGRYLVTVDEHRDHLWDRAGKGRELDQELLSDHREDLERYARFEIRRPHERQPRPVVLVDRPAVDKFPAVARTEENSTRLGDLSEVPD
jgi:hypothetical protein